MPPDLSTRLRAHAATLLGLLSDDASIHGPDACSALRGVMSDLLVLAAACECPRALDAATPAVRQREVLMRMVTASGPLRLLPPRPAPVPVCPRPAAEVLPFRRTTGPIAVLFAHETAPEDA